MRALSRTWLPRRSGLLAAVLLCAGMLVHTLAVAAPATATATEKSAALPPGTAIASAHGLATDAGFEIIRAGGNAFDAAVAVSAVLSVVEPIGSGIGGNGFFLLHEGKSGHDVFVDARETAPAAVEPVAAGD